jgi:uncharacterized protein YbjT (DUF2867 family)
MKIAVTTPSGHVGKLVTEYLLDAGADVRLLARRPEKLRNFVLRGAEVVRGSLDDPEYLASMTRGMDAMFWVTPPGYGSDSVRAYQNRMGMAAATAIRTNRIPRIVNLSAIGAHLSDGVGPISGLHDVEQLMGETAANVVHLRPGFFFENYLWQLDSIRDRQKVFLPVSGSRFVPMIACRDIARVAADRLLDSSWHGEWSQELHGPADMTFDEAAAALSEGLHRPITHVKLPPEKMRHGLIEQGFSENAAELLLEMYEAVELGRLRPSEARSPESTTPTTLAEFAHEVLQPLLAETVKQ